MPAHSPPSILFVDDNPDICDTTTELLRLAGFDVSTAASGQEALRLVRDRPDLVILDVCLPDLSGFEVCRRVRADPATASIPILHLSGRASSSEDRTQGLEGGADGYLLKPVAPAELIAHVRALLRLRRAEESLRESEERYRLIAENASAAVFMVDESSTILFANRTAEQVFGYSAEELLGRSLAVLMPQALADTHFAAVARYLDTGRRNIPWEGVEVKGVRRCGRGLYLQVSFGEFRDRTGSRRFVGVIMDISARKEAELALAALSRKLLHAQEEERRHIARELHDEVGQSLAALKMTLHTVPRAAEGGPSDFQLRTAVASVDRIIQQVRTLSLELRPPMLDDLGLVAALRWHVRCVAERSGLGVQLDADGYPGGLSTDVELACFRVIQESLNNVLKHARASRANVELRCEGDELHLLVRDDGVGFDVAAARRRSVQGASMGLLGIEERVRLIGGRLTVRSAVGEGSEVRACIPSRPKAPGGCEP